MFKFIIYLIISLTLINANDTKLNAALVYLKKAKDTKDENSANKAFKSLQALVKEKKTPLRTIWLGSSVCILAKYSFLPWKKLNYIEKCSKIMDNVVKKYPNNLKLRLVRINTYISLPSSLGKGALINKDMRFLLKNKNRKLNQKLKDKLFLVFIRFYLKEGQIPKAREYLNLIKGESIKKKAKTYFKEKNA